VDRLTQLVVVGAAGLLTLSAVAQESGQNSPATPAVKVESRIVVVDVVVTDANRKAVGGLTAKDFRIAEDGGAQTISSFEEHTASHTAPIALPEMPANVFTNFPATKMADSVNVILFDTLNTQPRDQGWVRQQLIDYLKGVEPGTRVAIFGLGTQLHLVRGFTTNFSGLSVALDDKKEGLHPELTRYLPTPSQHGAEMTVLGQMMKSRASPEAIEAFRRFMADESATKDVERVEYTLQAFQQLARYLSGIPARKNVIWFAGSFPISFVPESRKPLYKHQEAIQQTSDLLTAGKIAIYPVSAEGLVGDPAFDVNNMEGSRKELFDRQAAMQISMEQLAQQTGGHAYYNNNDFGMVLNDAIDTGSHYYALAYVPTNATLNGKFRKIQVNLADGDGYKLAYRRGYYADKPLSEQARENQEASDPLIPLIGFGLPNFDQILYKIEVLPSNPQPGAGAPRAGTNTALEGQLTTRYRVDFAVSPNDLHLTRSADGKRHGEIEVMLVAYDHDGKILNIVKRKSALTMDPKAFQSVQKAGLQAHEEIDVPQGEVYLRTGIFDLTSGNCGTLGIPLRTLPGGAPVSQGR
jgi:VWFA-related protein